MPFLFAGSFNQNGRRQSKRAKMPLPHQGIGGRIAGVGKISFPRELIRADHMPVAGKIVMRSEVVVCAGNHLQTQCLRSRLEFHRDLPVRFPDPPQVHATYYLVNSIDYTFGHKKGSHEAFVLADSGQVRFDSFTQ